MDIKLSNIAECSIIPAIFLRDIHRHLYAALRYCTFVVPTLFDKLNTFFPFLFVVPHCDLTFTTQDIHTPHSECTELMHY